MPTREALKQTKTAVHGHRYYLYIKQRDINSEKLLRKSLGKRRKSILGEVFTSIPINYYFFVYKS